MAFTDSVRGTDPTHAVRTRSLPRVDDWDDAGALAVENRVIDVAMGHGDALHLCLDESLLEARAPDRLSASRKRFDRVEESRRVLKNGHPEFRAHLPADADAVRACLALEPTDTDGWLARLFGVAEVAVVADDAWLYRSVPHHAHVRELDAEAVDGLRPDIREALAPIRGSGVVPVGAQRSWIAGGDRYELTWNALRRHPASSEGGSWTVFDLERLRGVRLGPERSTLQFRWRSRSDAVGSTSTVRRALASAVGRLATSPPTRVPVPDRAVAEAVVSTLGELRTTFEYDFALEE